MADTGEKTPLRVLIVEDVADDAELLLIQLGRAGLQVAAERVETAAELAQALDRQPWDVVISDYVLPGFSALDALAQVRRRDPDQTFIIVSGAIGEDQAVMAMKAGANDYMMKGNLARLAPAIERELREAESRRARRQAEQELIASRQQLRDLAGHLQTSLEEERTRIAREIHDEFGQALTGIKMDIAWLSKHLPGDDVNLARRTAGALNLVDDAILAVRRLATELRPPLLDKMGLAAALEWQAQEFSLHNGIECRVNLPAQEPEVEPALATAIFRICQEALTNVARHSKATQVQIDLENLPAGIGLRVKDNGMGMNLKSSAAKKSLGLVGMRERALSWNGSLTIDSKSGSGTTLYLIVPQEK